MTTLTTRPAVPPLETGSDAAAPVTRRALRPVETGSDSAAPATRRAVPPVETRSDAAARSALRAQVARLDWELSALAASGAPLPQARRRRRGARIMTLQELEGVRDELVERAACARRALNERGEAQELKRRALEEIALDPAQHRFACISREEIGEPGCGTWHARPRFGLLGMLMNWWRVKISSGCPLFRRDPRLPARGAAAGLVALYAA